MVHSETKGAQEMTEASPKDQGTEEGGPRSTWEPGFSVGHGVALGAVGATQVCLAVGPRAEVLRTARAPGSRVVALGGVGVEGTRLQTPNTATPPEWHSVRPPRDCSPEGGEGRCGRFPPRASAEALAPGLAKEPRAPGRAALKGTSTTGLPLS